MKKCGLKVINFYKSTIIEKYNYLWDIISTPSPSNESVFKLPCGMCVIHGHIHTNLHINNNHANLHLHYTHYSFLKQFLVRSLVYRVYTLLLMVSFLSILCL